MLIIYTYIMTEKQIIEVDLIDEFITIMSRQSWIYSASEIVGWLERQKEVIIEG